MIEIDLAICLASLVLVAREAVGVAELARLLDGGELVGHWIALLPSGCSVVDVPRVPHSLVGARSQPRTTSNPRASSLAKARFAARTSSTASWRFARASSQGGATPTVVQNFPASSTEAKSSGIGSRCLCGAMA